MIHTDGIRTIANAEPAAPTPDIEVVNEGTLFRFVPLTAHGSEWIYETAPEEALFFGPALVVEHRYAYDVALAATADGLVLQ